MECEKRGMLAVSMAGHDRGSIYVVWKEEGDAVFLTDGELRPLSKPKKKNKKHIQIIRKIREEWQMQISDNQKIMDEQIKYVLKCYRRERDAAKEK